MKRKNRKRNRPDAGRRCEAPKGAAVLLHRRHLAGDINRQLSTFYETPAVDEGKEDLKRLVAELTDRRLQQQQNATPTADDQMAPLGKSPTNWRQNTLNDGGQNGQMAQVPVAGTVTQKPQVQPVQAIRGNDRIGIAATRERCRLYPGLQPATKLRLQHGGRHGLRYGQEHDSRLHTPRPNP